MPSILLESTEPMNAKAFYQRHGKPTITRKLVDFLNKSPYSTVPQMLKKLRCREDTLRSILHKGMETGRFVRFESRLPEEKVRGRGLFCYAND